MKKLLLTVLGLSLFGASLTFAAGEGPGRITTYQAMARYAGPLTTEQQVEFREWLNEIADEREYVDEEDARAKYEALLEQANRPAQAGPAAHVAAAEAEVKEEEGEEKEVESGQEVKKREAKRGQELEAKREREWVEAVKAVTGEKPHISVNDAYLTLSKRYPGDETWQKRLRQFLNKSVTKDDYFDKADWVLAQKEVDRMRYEKSNVPATSEFLSRNTKFKQLPSDLAKHFNTFVERTPLPAASEWKIGLPKGAAPIEFARFPLANSNLITDKLGVGYENRGVNNIVASGDGKYVALNAGTGTIFVWNMQGDIRAPKEIIVGKDFESSSIFMSMALSSNGILACMMTHIYLSSLHVINVETGKPLWEKGFDKPAAFPVFYYQYGYENIGFRTGSDWRGSRVDKPNIEHISVSGIGGREGFRLQDAEMAYSLDGHKRVVKGEDGFVRFEKKEGSFYEVQWVPYGENKFPLNPKLFEPIALSADGNLFAVMKETGVTHDGKKKYSIELVRVKDGAWVTLEEINVGAEQLGFAARLLQKTKQSSSQNRVPVGITFSPAGRYVMWAWYDRDTKEVVVEAYDLDQVSFSTTF